MVAPQAVTGRLNVRNISVRFSAMQKVNMYKLHENFKTVPSGGGSEVATF